MICPSCKCNNDTVIDTRPYDEGRMVWRRRKCLVCSFRWTTFEGNEAEKMHDKLFTY